MTNREPGDFVDAICAALARDAFDRLPHGHPAEQAAAEILNAWWEVERQRQFREKTASAHRGRR